MSGVGWLVRHELRSRWRSVVALALVVGVLGGVVLAAAAGSRRTATAFDRFAAETATRDASVQIDDGDVDAALDQVERLDIVAASGRLEAIPAMPTDEALLTEIDLTLWASPDGGWAVDIDRPLVLEGRMPRSEAAGEVLLNELAARQSGLDLGDRFTVVTFTPEQLEALHSGGSFTGFGGPEVDLEVVGIGRQATDLQGAEVAAGGTLLVSPATHRLLDGEAAALGGMASIDLAPGATVDHLRDAVRRIVGPDASFDVRSAEEEFVAATEDATSVLARALAAFAAVAAVAGAVAVGGTISRQCAFAHATSRTLAAVGCDRRQRTATTVVVPVAGVGAGVVLALVGAVLASSRFPMSVARRVEPDPGLELDGLVLLPGAVVMVVGGVAWALLAVRRLERLRPTIVRRRSRTPLALPPSVAIGISHAFDGRAGDRTVPVRAALAAAVLGVVGVVGAATVIHSFDTLAGEPARYGWAWSAEPDIYTDDPEALAGELSRADGVEALAARHTARLELDGFVVSGAAFEIRHGRIEPPVREGRLPAAPDEVALGARTADQLDVAIGDRLEARTATGAGTVEVELVGIVVNAPVEVTDPATGAVVTLEGLEQLRRSDGYTAMLVRYEPGFDPTALEAGYAARALADFSVVYARPRLPGSLENLQRAMPIVTALGGFFVVVAVVGAAHALVLGSRRRRRELATLHALGMPRRRVRAVIVVTALSTAAVGLVVGVPLGLVVGRAAWRAVIGSHGLLDAPALPEAALALVAPAALATALLVSWWPALRATRATSHGLRSE